MPANALHRDVDAIDVGQREARRVAYRPGRHRRCRVMEGQHVIGLWKPLVQSVFQHRESAETQLFGRLQDHDQRTLPFVLALSQKLRRADEAGHMRVVSAGMHHAGRHTAGGRGHDCARVRQSGLLDNRQTVHIRAQHDSGPVAVFHDGNNAGLSDALGHFEAEIAHACCQLGGSLVFFEA